MGTSLVITLLAVLIAVAAAAWVIRHNARYRRRCDALLIAGEQIAAFLAQRASHGYVWPLNARALKQLLESYHDATHLRNIAIHDAGGAKDIRWGIAFRSRTSFVAGEVSIELDVFDGEGTHLRRIERHRKVNRRFLVPSIR